MLVFCLRCVEVVCCSSLFGAPLSMRSHVAGGELRKLWLSLLPQWGRRHDMRYRGVSVAWYPARMLLRPPWPIGPMCGAPKIAPEVLLGLGAILAAES